MRLSLNRLRWPNRVWYPAPEEEDEEEEEEEEEDKEDDAAW